jgi:8-oxo-dGTP pyrophosphatase MutT (NUDIX family)
VSDTPKHSVSVAGIVVRDDGRVLAVRRRDNRHWEPPGSVVELYETFDRGVRREVFEETGIEVEVERVEGSNSPTATNSPPPVCSPSSITNTVSPAASSLIRRVANTIPASSTSATS